MNCAVKVIQDTSCLPGPTPALPTPKKTAPIKSTEDLIRKFPDRFQGIGQFPGEYTIRLCDNSQPIIHAPWKCPISIYSKVKAELDKMVKLGVITPVDEPTDWVSSVAYAWKASGELCICLDPCDLNNAICRDHHHTPTLDEVSHEFVYSKYFTNWMPDMDTGQLSLTPNPVCSPPLTPHIVDITSYVFPLAYPAPRMFSRGGWIKYWKNVKVT